MGASMAAAAIHNNHNVFWASAGRSQSTRTRAEKYMLSDAGSLEELCKQVETLISVCPPHAAEDLARSVVELNFKGTYVDTNAISPQRATRIGEIVESAGISFVDGGIIGGPAWEAKGTWLYLSGKEANKIAALFSGSLLETKVIGSDIGKASALKMCYAAYSKGSTALLSAALAAADRFDLMNELNNQWEMDFAGFSVQAADRVTRVTKKAWRFEGEMKEIADTFSEAGLPVGFHLAAAEIYSRMSKFKSAEQRPALDDILKALNKG
jgi:3-hydroxyisobutyrate dehydrogenase-like beta-hydroxyacid dehydrogenase